MRRRTGPTAARGGSRAAFTLIELLIVIAIIALLVTLSVAAVFRTLASQQARATEATLEKVASVLDRQVKAVVDEAKGEAVPPSVFTQLAGNDARRARVIWIKLRLKQEFPTSYAEAHNPAPGYLAGKNAYKVLPAAANDPATESSACLLLALTQSRRGVTWDADQSLGAGCTRDTDGDGAREIIDAWGTALYFVRWPTTNPDLNPNGLTPGINDNQDPDGLLSDPSWVSGGNLFSQLCYPVAPGKSYKDLNPFVASCGSNKVREDNPPTGGDDLFSYRLRSLGSRGD